MFASGLYDHTEITRPKSDYRILKQIKANYFNQREQMAIFYLNFVRSQALLLLAETKEPCSLGSKWEPQRL